MKYLAKLSDEEVLEMRRQYSRGAMRGLAAAVPMVLLIWGALTLFIMYTCGGGR
jgi:hypothetical protein